MKRVSWRVALVIFTGVVIFPATLALCTAEPPTGGGNATGAGERPPAGAEPTAAVQSAPTLEPTVGVAAASAASSEAPTGTPILATTAAVTATKSPTARPTQRPTDQPVAEQPTSVPILPTAVPPTAVPYHVIGTSCTDWANGHAPPPARGPDDGYPWEESREGSGGTEYRWCWDVWGY